MSVEQYSILDQISFSNDELLNYEQFKLRIRAEKEVYAENNPENTEIIEMISEILKEITLGFYKTYVAYRRKGIAGVI